MALRFAKSALQYWAAQTEDHLVQFVAVSLAASPAVFAVNPGVQRKFLAQLADSLVHVRDSRAKLAILLACKALVPRLGGETLVRFFKVR